MECYNISGETKDDDPRYINILESEESWGLEGPSMPSDKFLNPLKIEKVNIGSCDSHMFANIGEYWDDEIVGNIIDLLHEFQ